MVAWFNKRRNPNLLVSLVFNGKANYARCHLKQTLPGCAASAKALAFTVGASPGPAVAVGDVTTPVRGYRQDDHSGFSSGPSGAGICLGAAVALVGAAGRS